VPSVIRSDAVVLGAGPAGCVAAKRLAAAGYRVAVIAGEAQRSFHEGASERVVEGLRRDDGRHALAAVGSWVPRTAHWNGEGATVNGEYLVDRRALDRGLIRDAAEAGAFICRGRVSARSDSSGLHRVLATGPEGAAVTIAAEFLIEARGRQAPLRGRSVKGPPTTAFVQRWQVPADVGPATVIAGFADGWGWLAVPGDGTASVQIVVSGRRGAAPRRDGAELHFRSWLGRLPEIDGAIADGVPQGGVAARGANAVRAREVLDTGGRSIRIGDAALAIDPLSGHGMFEAVSTALAAVPVIRTLLERPGSGAAARTFYQERIEQAFYRHARAGRELYAREGRWPDSPFWRERSAWPDSESAHAAPQPAAARIDERPVVEDGYIVVRQVVVTPDHPRGVWQIDGVPLVPLLSRLRDNPVTEREIVQWAAAVTDRPTAQVSRALAWLRYRGLLVGSDRCRVDVIDR